MTGQAEAQTPPRLSAGALSTTPRSHPPADSLPPVLLCHLATAKGEGEEIPGGPALQPAFLLRQPGRAAPPGTHPDGGTLLHELQQLGLGRPRVPQHQQVDVPSASQSVGEPGGRRAGGRGGLGLRPGRAVGGQSAPTITASEHGGRQGLGLRARSQPHAPSLSHGNWPPREGGQGASPWGWAACTESIG